MLLNITVLGIAVVTSIVPAAIVSAPAIPKVEFDDSCNDVPFMFTLNRSASPLRVEVPVNVIVPAVAMKEPLTVRLLEIKRSDSAVIDPVIKTVPRFLVPAPDIVFEEPFMPNTPAPVVKLPDTDRLPERDNGVVVLIVP